MRVIHVLVFLERLKIDIFNLEPLKLHLINQNILPLKSSLQIPMRVKQGVLSWPDLTSQSITWCLSITPL